MIKLSIIIPHYNSADLLKKLLSTIPNIPELQVLVVDDFSTQKLDELKECKQKFTNTNVEFYTNECKKSAGGARNTGLKYAKGQWLLFADADDYFIDGFYDTVKKYFDKDYDSVYFVPTSIDLRTNKVSDRHHNSKILISTYLERPTTRNCLRMKYKIVGPVSILIRSDVVHNNKIRFDEQKVANDVMAVIQIAFHAKTVCASEEVIYCITKQEGTLTAVLSKENFDMRKSVYFRKCRYLKENLPKNEYRKLHFDARVLLKTVKTYKLGRKEYFSLLKRIIKEGIPIWREFSPMYYYDVIHFLLNKDRYLS